MSLRLKNLQHGRELLFDTDFGRIAAAYSTLFNYAPEDIRVNMKFVISQMDMQ
jgi:hypothetical protein